VRLVRNLTVEERRHASCAYCRQMLVVGVGEVEVVAEWHGEAGALISDIFHRVCLSEVFGGASSVQPPGGEAGSLRPLRPVRPKSGSRKKEEL
jgi:hypothetical protein